MDILGKSKTYVVTRSKSKQNEEIENEMVECEVHSQDLLDDHVLTLAQPFLTTLVKQSGSPFYNHLLTPIFSSKHCSHNILCEEKTFSNMWTFKCFEPRKLFPYNNH
jgi:hypothetical protein